MSDAPTHLTHFSIEANVTEKPSTGVTAPSIGKCVRCVGASEHEVALRPYQAGLVDRLRDTFRMGFRAPLLQTESGPGTPPLASTVQP